MNKTTIHCKTTAPLFMAGAEQARPELRAASIKGNMRFIWRAIQRADSIDKLRETEGHIFGNAFGGDKTKASQMRIRVENLKMANGSEIMVPHRNLSEYDGKKGPFPAQALRTNGTFDIIISSFINEESHIDYVRLFAITCLLYGFGRRSRKGFGTVDITGIAGLGDDVNYWFDGAVDNLNALSKFGAKYSSVSNTEITASGGGAAKYPYIENIKISGSQSFSETGEIIKQIGMSAHIFSRSIFLGESSPRFASSVLLSTMSWDADNYCCIVTQLNCTKHFNTEERDDFYNEINGRV